MARFTILFERLAVDVLVECGVAGAGRVLRTSWDETWHLMERAVARGLRVKEPGAPVHLGVDEKSAGRSRDYITIVTDLDKGTVDADHGNSPLSIIEIPQVLARGGVMPETTRSSWASPPW
jgi:hypothetical protein